MLIKELMDESKFTEAEQIVAQYILQNINQCCRLSAEELGKASYTSGSTVTRLAKKMGFKGFSDFKIALATESSKTIYQKELVNINVPFEKEDDDKIIVDKMIQLNLDAVEQIRDTIDISSLRKATDLMKGIKTIDFYGTGVSHCLCVDSAEKFKRIGIRTNCINEIQAMWSNVNLADKDTLSLFVSYTGINKEYLKLCQVLRNEGHKIITLTGLQGNPLSLLGDVNLMIYTKEYRTKIGAFASRTSMMVMLDLLFSIYFHDNMEKNMKFINQITERNNKLKIHD